MTTEAIAPVADYAVQGTGPYAILWPYGAGDIRASVVLAGIEYPLAPTTDFTVAPDEGQTGDLSLSAGAAATYAGGQIYITRDTLVEQGWVGNTAREVGLTAQLDRLARALLDVKEKLSRVLFVKQAHPTILPVDDTVLVYQGGRFVPGPSVTDLSDAATAAQEAEDAAAQAAAYAALAISAQQNLTHANRGPWAAAVAYTQGQLVQEAGATYLCLANHTSVNFAADLAAGRWVVFAARGLSGNGTGDVIAANNGAEYTPNAGLFRNAISAMLRAITPRTGLNFATDTTLDSSIYNAGTGNTQIPVGAGDGDSFIASKIDAANYNYLWFGHARAWLGRRVSNVNSWVEIATASFVTGRMQVAQFSSRYGTGGGGAAFPTGTFSALALTDTDINGHGITRVGNQLKFANAGTYLIEAAVPFCNASGTHRGAQIGLYNVTQAAQIALGQSAYIVTGSTVTLTVSGYAVIAANDLVELLGMASGPSCPNGRAAGLSQEVYNIVRVRAL